MVCGFSEVVVDGVEPVVLGVVTTGVLDGVVPGVVLGVVGRAGVVLFSMHSPVFM